MRTLRRHYPLSLLCRVLEVSRSGYYAWHTRRPSRRAQENARLEVAIQAAHVRTRQTYGPERLQAELREDGFPAGIGRIKRLRKKLGLRCISVHRWTITTDSAHHLPVADNLLAQTFTATRPRMRPGSPTSPMSLPGKGGCMWPGSRTCIHVRWSAMPWGPE